MTVRRLFSFFLFWFVKKILCEESKRLSFVKIKDKKFYKTSSNISSQSRICNR